MKGQCSECGEALELWYLKNQPKVLCQMCLYVSSKNRYSITSNSKREAFLAFLLSFSKRNMFFCKDIRKVLFKILGEVWPLEIFLRNTHPRQKVSSLEFRKCYCKSLKANLDFSYF